MPNRVLCCISSLPILQRLITFKYQMLGYAYLNLFKQSIASKSMYFVFSFLQQGWIFFLILLNYFSGCKICKKKIRFSYYSSIFTLKLTLLWKWAHVVVRAQFDQSRWLFYYQAWFGHWKNPCLECQIIVSSSVY